MSDLLNEMARIAQKYTPVIAQGIRRIFEELRKDIPLEDAVRVLSTQGITGLLSYLDDMEDRVEEGILNTIYNAYLESGRALVVLLPVGALTARFTFNAIDPGTIPSLLEHNAQLVAEISNETRRAIVQNVQTNILAGINPIDAARDFRESIGLTEFQERAVSNYRRALEQPNLDEIRAMLRDDRRLLRDKRSDRSLRRVLEGQRLQQDQIDSMVDRYRKRYIKYRSESIARTESLRAVTMGEYHSLLQAQQQGKLDPDLRRFWVATRDERTRAHHIVIPQMNKKGVRVGEMFQTPQGLMRFPRDPQGLASNVINCRCRVVYDFVDENNEPIGTPPEVIEEAA